MDASVEDRDTLSRGSREGDTAPTGGCSDDAVGVVASGDCMKGGGGIPAAAICCICSAVMPGGRGGIAIAGA